MAEMKNTTNLIIDALIKEGLLIASIGTGQEELIQITEKGILEVQKVLKEDLYSAMNGEEDGHVYAAGKGISKDELEIEWAKAVMEEFGSPISYLVNHYATVIYVN